MAVQRSLVGLITDGAGFATKDFLAKTPAQWADEQMLARYSQGKLPDDKPGDFPYDCWVLLCDEYLALQTWFDKTGKLNPLLQSVMLTGRLSGPIKDGVSWDWKTNGDPDVRMYMFKGPLIAAWRAAMLIPADDRNSGNMQLGGLATIIRSAYTERAKIHRWVGYDRDNVKYTADNMSRRWVSHMTNNFLIKLGADRKWSWEVSKCKSVFGPIEEESQIP